METDIPEPFQMKKLDTLSLTVLDIDKEEKSNHTPECIQASK